MQQNHLLNIPGSCYALINNLSGILDEPSLSLIRNELISNAQKLIKFGKYHYNFATKLNSRNDWRQKVSRFYYAGYNISRGVRLLDTGQYTTDSSDHKKISDLPDKFPNKSKYTNELRTLRDDRNLCDYDHLAKKSDLIISPTDAEKLIYDFHNDALDFIKIKIQSM